MPGGGELFGERNRGVAPPDHRPVGGRVARAEVEVVVRTEARGVVPRETEAGIPALQLLAAGDERGVAESFGAAAVERVRQQSPRPYQQAAVGRPSHGGDVWRLTETPQM